MQMQTAKCFEVYTGDGSLICRIYFTERELPIAEQKAPAAEDPPAPHKEQARSDDATMTAPQRRMLFRLMATHRGLEGEKAHEELKKRFQAKSLQEVSKLDASRMIEHLLSGKGGNGHGSPVQ
jgi:hypothetical protein